MTGSSPEPPTATGRRRSGWVSTTRVRRRAPGALGPDIDPARFELALSAALDQCGEFVSEHRIVRPDGSAVWFELDD